MQNEKPKSEKCAPPRGITVRESWLQDSTFPREKPIRISERGPYAHIAKPEIKKQ